jgi:hypothetical protein
MSASNVLTLQRSGPWWWCRLAQMDVVAVV